MVTEWTCADGTKIQVGSPCPSCKEHAAALAEKDAVIAELAGMLKNNIENCYTDGPDEVVVKTHVVHMDENEIVAWARRRCGFEESSCRPKWPRPASEVKEE